MLPAFQCLTPFSLTGLYKRHREQRDLLMFTGVFFYLRAEPGKLAPLFDGMLPSGLLGSERFVMSSRL